MKKPINFLFIVLILIIALISIYVSLCNLSYFNIENVELHSDSRIEDELPSDVQRILSSLIGTNIFKINLNSVKNNLLGCQGIIKANIKRFFPDKLIINLDFNKFLIKIKTEKAFYCADSDKIYEVSNEKFDYYKSLNQVEISENYASFLLKWGYDEGFIQMLELASQLQPKFLITAIKYDNNNGNDFGYMILSFSNRNSELCIREPVTYKRLEEALAIMGEEGHYDLYANSLIKRAWGTY